MAIDKLFEAGAWSVKAPFKVTNWAARVLLDTLSQHAADSYANSRFTLNDDMSSAPDLTVIEGDAMPVVGGKPPTGTASERLRAAVILPHDKV